MAALGYTRGQGVDISVRSGGHGVSVRSTNDGGIVIDLSRMTSVEVLDRESGRIRIEPGARWGRRPHAGSPRARHEFVGQRGSPSSPRARRSGPPGSTTTGPAVLEDRGAPRCWPQT
ncbi:FAD-binding protein [Streptomyces sp. NPDC057877]|uniref:FAD-binding protein n=1 Tax=Streptomyces sp. NPDC057877 TaxID=3346269 RepID=UPI0036A2EA85